MKKLPDVTTREGLQEIEEFIYRNGAVFTASNEEGCELNTLLLLTIAKQNVRIIELLGGNKPGPMNVLDAFKPH